MSYLSHDATKAEGGGECATVPRECCMSRREGSGGVARAEGALTEAVALRVSTVEVEWRARAARTNERNKQTPPHGTGRYDDAVDNVSQATPPHRGYHNQTRKITLL